jgi:hypothetical protein
MREIKCPETIEELEELERRLPICRKGLYEARKAKIESGAACSQREAERQLAEETGKPIGTVRRAIWEEEQKTKVAQTEPPHESTQNILQISEKQEKQVVVNKHNPAHASGPGRAPKYAKPTANAPAIISGSQAIYLAEIAISQLSRIELEDPKRDEAFQKVIDWIKKQPGGNAEEVARERALAQSVPKKYSGKSKGKPCQNRLDATAKS